jgi:hypothetical protein
MRWRMLVSCKYWAFYRAGYYWYRGNYGADGVAFFLVPAHVDVKRPVPSKPLIIHYCSMYDEDEWWMC